jgi:hypothetical protein
MKKALNYHHLLLSALACALVFSAPQDAFAKAKGKGKNLKPAAATQAAAASEADLRLDLDKLSLLISTGEYDSATQLLNKLEAKYPNNPQVHEAAADLYAQMDNRGEAFKLASQQTTPDAEARQREILLSPKGQFVAGGFNSRQTSEAFESMTTFSAQTALAHDLAISANFMNDYISTRTPFTRTNGTTQSFYGNRQTGSVSLDKFFTGGHEVIGTVYAVANNAGIGGRYNLWDADGYTGISADLNRPEFDYVEMAVQHGTNNNVMIERKQFFSEAVQAKIDGKYTFYSIDHADNVAEAPGWDFDLDYLHNFYLSGSNYASNKRDALAFGAHYNVNAEYFTHVRGDTIGSTFFHPLPVATYEVHSWTVTLDKELLSGLKGEIGGGYGVNRIAGNSGPIYAFLLDYSPAKNVNLEFHANRTMLGGQNNGEKENNVGADLKWNW